MMSTSDSVHDWDLLPVYTVKSWNKPINANTNKLRSSNSWGHRVKPKHLEADSATGSWTYDNRRPVGRLDKMRKHPCVNWTERSGIPWMYLPPDPPQA